MRPKSLLLLGLALGCGLVASIGISQVMDRNANGNAKLETVPIYVALHNINLGDPIDSAVISLQEWPKDKVPHGAISKLEDLDGRRPRTAIIEGEPILEGKLLAPGQIADPIRSIQKGMRLKTIAVDAEKSAAGLLGPGDRVDVQLFVRKDARSGVEVAKSKIILQNIRVFAVDQTVQRSADGSEEKKVAKTVSLMLTPEQASKLSLAEQIGELSLIPRNPDDDEAADWTEYTVDDLMAVGEKNSRQKEQGITETKPAEPTHEAPAEAKPNVVVAPPKPAKEPFRMEIVEAQGVREVLFDGDTGRVIQPSGDKGAPAGPTLPASAKPAADHAVTPQGEAAKTLDEFPIKFDSDKG
ncbi:MAG TPA: Flp pilus assembly protein CpaB [Lacipirellulaceae bacterium]|jgi:pilus assembly protein CpaB|nr:Flp pilus assembly protein CpaB [Lacipirellulaceae bacterium]